MNNAEGSVRLSTTKNKRKQTEKKKKIGPTLYISRDLHGVEIGVGHLGVSKLNEGHTKRPYIDKTVVCLVLVLLTRDDLRGHPMR